MNKITINFLPTLLDTSNVFLTLKVVFNCAFITLFTNVKVSNISYASVAVVTGSLS